MSHSGTHSTGGWSGGTGASGLSTASGQTSWALAVGIGLFYDSGAENDNLVVTYVPAPQLVDVGQGTDVFVA